MRSTPLTSEGDVANRVQLAWDQSMNGFGFLLLWLYREHMV